MTVIKINAITVPGEHGEEVARRFAERAGAVDGQEGFEGFELLRPTDGRDTWLVVSRWRDDASFQAWLSSPSFAHGHRGVSGPPEGAGHPGGAAQGGGERPLGLQAELWSYDVATSAAPKA
jgi:heme-degrading monooxygenase HmoA